FHRAELICQLDAAHAGHLDVGDDAGEAAWIPGLQEFLRRPERLSGVSGRAQQTRRSRANAVIVVGDGYQQVSRHLVHRTSWRSSSMDHLVNALECGICRTKKIIRRFYRGTRSRA